MKNPWPRNLAEYLRAFAPVKDHPEYIEGDPGAVLCRWCGHGRLLVRTTKGTGTYLVCLHCDTPPDTPIPLGAAA